MNWTRVRARTEKGEGRTTYMYQCTKGRVTAGVGHLIENVECAIKLPWWFTACELATAEQIRRDYTAVATAKSGMPASAYAKLSDIRLSQDAVDALLQQDFDRFIPSLKAKVPSWDKLPELAQEALFDIAFNCGIGGFMKFVKLRASVAAGDWEAAAVQCHRRDIGEDRNTDIANLFSQAAKVNA